MRCGQMRRWVLAALLCGWGATAWAGGAATVTLVHGINGADVGQEEALPIDVWINGELKLTDVTFRTFSEPLTLPSGMSTIEIYAAGALGQGVATPLASVQAEFENGLDYSVLAHLDLLSEPTLTAFFNDLSALAGRNVYRETVRHGAVAPVIDAIWYPRRPNNPPQAVLDVANSEEGGPADFGAPPFCLDLFIKDAGSGDELLGPVPFLARRRVYYYHYLVGSEANGTLEVLQETRKVGR